MSWQAMDAVDQLPYDIAGALAYRVLVKLANVAGQDGRHAWRSRADVAQELGVSVRSVQRALAELEQLNLIRRGDQRHVGHIRADRRPTVYDVNMSWRSGQPQLAELPPDPDNLPLSDDGVTELLTGAVDNSYGVTHGGTAVVAHRELIELPRDKSLEVTTDRARDDRRGDCGHEIVHVGDDGRRYCKLGCTRSEVGR